MIGIHPERVSGDPRAVRWVMPAGTLAVGRVCRARGRLGDMLSDGTISAALAEHGALWLWLRAGESGPNSAMPVQAAPASALAIRPEW